MLGHFAGPLIQDVRRAPSRLLQRTARRGGPEGKLAGRGNVRAITATLGGRIVICGFPKAHSPWEGDHDGAVETAVQRFFTKGARSHPLPVLSVEKEFPTPVGIGQNGAWLVGADVRGLGIGRVGQKDRASRRQKA